MTVTVHPASLSPTFAVMTAVPSFLPVTLPLWFTVATSSAFVLQVTVLSSVVFAGTSVAVSVSLSFFRISSSDLSSRTS